MYRSSVFYLYWSIFIASLLIFSCSKKESAAPDPDMANAVSGAYDVTAVTIAGSSQPQTVSGTVVIVRDGTALDKVILTLTYRTASSSGSSTFSESKNISLQQSGSSIDLYNATTKVGNWAASTVTLTNYPFNNSMISLTAAKQQ